MNEDRIKALREKAAREKATPVGLLRSRLDLFPVMMDTLVHLIIRYLEKSLPAEAFVPRFLEEAGPFYRRVELGYKHEEYAENYAAEILLIRSVSAACEDGRAGRADEAEICRRVEEAAALYHQNSTPIKKHFPC